MNDLLEFTINAHGGTERALTSLKRLPQGLSAMGYCGQWYNNRE
jgi:hypothetical protein